MGGTTAWRFNAGPRRFDLIPARKTSDLSSIRTLRYVALIEATSLLVLLVATYIKYANDSPGGVKVMGPRNDGRRGGCRGRPASPRGPTPR
jgi:uncharacterized protein DUF3817